MQTVYLRLDRKFKISLPPPPLQSGIILIRGRNGCGKTTLLQLLASKHPIKLRQFLKENGSHFLRNSSLFFEESMLSHAESLRTNLNYINAFVSMDTERQKILIKQLNLNHVINQAFKKCSTGEKKKFISILNLTQKNKNILFLDEPMENIDEPSKIYLLSLLKSKTYQRKSIYIATQSTAFFKTIDFLEFNLNDCIKNSY